MKNRNGWRKRLHDNGLSIAFGAMFVVFLIAQTLTGHATYNQDQRDHRQPTIGYREYLFSPHSIEATAENWESEFLQMAMYVLLTVFLYQRGSAESKDPDKKEPVDREPSPSRKGAPRAVQHGGLTLKLYQNSLGLAFAILFLVSFALHAAGGAAEYSEDQLQHGGEAVGMLEYMATARFWFESFQNWQSEFLAVGSMVVLSIFLRQHGSPESKPVDASHEETGNG
jgi:hypothetical protein